MEKKKWTLEEIIELETDRDTILPWKKFKIIAVKRLSTDEAGWFLHRLFQKIDGDYEELDIQEMNEVVSEYLAKNVNAKRLLKDVLEKAQAPRLIELYMDILDKKPKVTVGVQKGSCYYLYVGGKEKGIYLQLTE